LVTKLNVTCEILRRFFNLFEYSKTRFEISCASPAMAWICKISNRRLNVYLSYTEGSNHVQQGSDLLVGAEKYICLGCHDVSSLEVKVGSPNTISGIQVKHKLHLEARLLYVSQIQVCFRRIWPTHKSLLLDEVYASLVSH
jgi:hypothetical protein